jgi:hypothetical protein
LNTILLLSWKAKITFSHYTILHSIQDSRFIIQTQLDIPKLIVPKFYLMMIYDLWMGNKATSLTAAPFLEVVLELAVIGNSRILLISDRAKFN